MVKTVAQNAWSLGTEVSDYVHILTGAGFVGSGDRYALIIDGIAVVSVDLVPDDISESKIWYHRSIRVKNAGSLSFCREENFVALLCLSTLLGKGYSPENLCVSKGRSLYAGGRGSLLVHIMKGDGGTSTSWAVVECKSWGDYASAQSRTRKDGGHLFAELSDEPSMEYLYLYTSRLRLGHTECKSDFIDTKQLGIRVGSAEELYATWDRTFVPGGIFGADAEPYDSERCPLTMGDLRTLDEDTASDLFAAFAEVLRRHAVSDGSSAFNALLNLFICKIADEDDRQDEDNLDFQFSGSEGQAELLVTLNSLYRKGMARYLNTIVDPAYTSDVQSFRFVDVFDGDSFGANFRVLREIVCMLQPYEIRGASGQQFFGDMFELLVDLRAKQESGQFFTPSPLGRFMARSLPLQRVTNESSRGCTSSAFPRIIDYACGTGHLLVQAVGEVRPFLDGMAQPPKSLRSGFSSTYDNVFGIERDMRLAKAAKITTFLSGDNGVTILPADGLDSFRDSARYTGPLLHSDDDTPSKNGQFDVLVANPPYSVSNFRENGAATSDSFDLMQYISFRGSEIECLFVERSAQLLRDGGVAAIILPATFLTKGGAVYQEARKLLLRKFHLRAAVQLGKNAFMSTFLPTVILFLERRPDSQWSEAIDLSVGNQAAAIARLLEGDHTLIASTGEDQAEKNFLGYEFGKRRGSEGIRAYNRSSLCSPNENPGAPYLDDLIRASFSGEDVANLLLSGKARLSTLDDETVRDVSPIYEQSRFVATSSLLGSGDAAFSIDLSSAPGSDGAEDRYSRIAYATLGDLLANGLVDVAIGARPKGGSGHVRSGPLSLGGEHINETFGTLKLARKKRVPIDFFSAEKAKKAHVSPGDILICKDGARSGKVALVTDVLTEPAMVSEHAFRIGVTAQGATVIDAEYLFLYLFSAEGRGELARLASGSAQKSISNAGLLEVRVPCPPIDTQRAVASELRAIPVTQGYSFPFTHDPGEDVLSQP